MRVAAAVLLALVAGAARAFTLSEVPRAYRVAGNRSFLAAADFDRDGAVDVFSFGRDGGSDILYGEGDKSFAAPAVLAQNWNVFPFFSSSITEPFVVDIDSDGDSDIIDSQTGGITVLRENLGQRRFAADVTIAQTGWKIAVADFTGDGHPDVLRRGATDAEGTLMINDGHGRFPVSRNAGAPPSPYFGDFDGDGDIDLAVANANGVTLFDNDGSGFFRAGTSIAEKAATSWLVADIDEDGRADLVALRSSKNELAVYLARNFAGTPAVLAAGTKPNRAIAADFNADGFLDLAVRDDYSVMIFRGDGRGGLTRAFEVLARWGDSLAAADFDGDGALDLAIGQANLRPEVAIVRGNGDGTFRVPPSIRVPANRYLQDAGDFDGDGIDELLVSSGNRGPWSIGWMTGRRAYRFEPLPIPGTVTYESVIRLGSVDAENRVQAIVGVENAIHILSASAAGAWSVRSFSIAGTVLRVETAELAPTAGREIVAITRAPETKHDYTLRVFSAAGSQLFSVPLIPPPQPGFGTMPATFYLVTADADRDGRTDLFVVQDSSHSAYPHDFTRYADGYVALFRGHGDVTLAAEERILRDALIDFATIADFEGDGNVDLAVLPLDWRQWRAYAGDGRGNFVQREQLLPFYPFFVFDFNRDGYPDLFDDRISYGSATGFQPPTGYLWTALGVHAVRRSPNAPPALMRTINDRGDTVIVDDPPLTRPRAVRH